MLASNHSLLDSTPLPVPAPFSKVILHFSEYKTSTELHRMLQRYISPSRITIWKHLKTLVRIIFHLLLFLMSTSFMTEECFCIHSSITMLKLLWGTIQSIKVETHRCLCHNQKSQSLTNLQEIFSSLRQRAALSHDGFLANFIKQKTSLLLNLSNASPHCHSKMKKDHWYVSSYCQWLCLKLCFVLTLLSEKTTACSKGDRENAPH